MNDENFGVALVHEICPLCGEKLNEHILMNSVLTKNYADKVKEAHGKAIDFSEHPCEDCQAKLNNGYKAVIGIDPDKSNTLDDKVKFTNMYRLGTFFIKKELILEWFPEAKDQLENNDFIIVDKDTFNQIKVVSEKIESMLEEVN